MFDILDTRDITVAAMLLLTALSFYLIGVGRGKKWATRKVVLEFQEVVHKLLHFAAKEDYKSIHLMLHDISGDEGSTYNIKEPPEEEKESTD